MAKTSTESSIRAQEDALPLSTGSPVDPKTEILLTRAEAAARIGISITELRRREASGKLRPRKRDEKGWYLFSPEDVDNQANAVATTLIRKSVEPPPYTPEEVSDVFGALEAGKSLIQCVKECGVMPVTVELIAADYARLTGGMYLRKDAMDIINALPLEGAFPLKSDSDLVAVLKAASVDTCRKCNTRARVLCKPCALKTADRAAKEGL